MTTALRGRTILVAHEDATCAADIERAVRAAGGEVPGRAANVAEAIERICGPAPSAVIFSAGLAGDTRALIDVAANRGTRLVILYPARSEPGFPFDDQHCLIAPYTDVQLVEALAETLSVMRGCLHWSVGPFLWD
jgi:hypothetical protein